MLSLPNIIANIANGVRNVLGNTSLNIQGRPRTVNNTPTAGIGTTTPPETPKPEIIKGVPNVYLFGGAAVLGIYLLTMKKPRRR